jgi:hypothetical protein
MLGKPSLEIEIGELLAETPLLERNTMKKLYNRYKELTKTDIKEWMTKTLDKEKDVGVVVLF